MSWRDYRNPDSYGDRREAFERSERSLEKQLICEGHRERRLDYTPLYDANACEPDPPAGANE